MRFFEDDLIYDTEKSELIAESEIVPYGDGFGYLEHEKMKWYVTQNGNFFVLRRPYRKKKIGIFSSKLVPSGKREFYGRFLTSVINELKEYGLSEKANEIADKYLKEA